MNNVIMLKVALSSQFQPLSADSLVGTFEISCPPENNTSAIFKADNGDEVPWRKGEYHVMTRIDLSRIFVKGAQGDTVTIVGGTW